MTTYKILHVIWLDSEASNEWTDIDTVSDELDRTHSVGLLIKETETYLLLSLSLDPGTTSINNYKKIPRLAIESMRTVGKLKV